MNTVTVNGVRIAYHRRGRGRPLLLVHGFPLDHSVWEELAALLEDDFDLILPDLRGFGASSDPREGDRIEQYAGDLLAILNHLRVERALVAGHSMGGYVALALARLVPERLLGLGLIATQHLADAPERAAGRLALAESVLRDGLAAVAGDMSGRLTANADQVPALRELILRQRPAGVAGALRAMAGRPDSTELLRRFRLPVVIVTGLADALIPPERSREMAALLPQARLHELEGVGHMPMMEAPRRVAEALRELLPD